jgi:hypothetical protein
MEFLGQLLPILRPLHIIFGMLWFGFGSLAVWILHPAAASMGAKGDKLLRAFYGYSRYGAVVGISAITTSIAGLLMWPVLVDGANHRVFGNTADVVFVIGAIAGILAWLHGGAATGKYVGKFAALSKALEENADPGSEQLAAYEEAKKKMFVHTNISAWITLVAVLGMALARYMPNLW